MDESLYKTLVATGLSPEEAQKIASRYVAKEAVKPKISFTEWIREIKAGSAVVRLQVVLGILQKLRIKPSEDTVQTIEQYKADTHQLLSRLGQVMESSWLPQRDKDNRVAGIAIEIEQAFSQEDTLEQLLLLTGNEVTTEPTTLANTPESSEEEPLETPKDLEEPAMFESSVIEDTEELDIGRYM